MVFIPGQNGDYPSVCLPQNSPQTTTTTTTKKPFHDHLYDVHWALPGLFPPVDPFLQSFHSSLLYEPLLGWFRSDSSGKETCVCVGVFNLILLIYFSNIRYMYTWLLFKGQLRGASNKSQKCNGPCKQKVNTRLNKKYNNKKIKKGKYKRKIQNISNTRYQSSEINLFSGFILQSRSAKLALFSLGANIFINNE